MPGRVFGNVVLPNPALVVAQQGGGDFTTLRAAKNAAHAGDCIIVYPGTYKENDLLKDGVNWFFMPGAVVDYTETSLTSPGYGIFDDRSSGAVTCVVGGEGIFKYKDVTQALGAANANILGMVVISNASTVFKIRAREFNAGTFNFGGAGTAIQVSNCSRVDIDVDAIIDPNYQQTVLDPDDGVTVLQSSGYGLIWIIGESYLRFGIMKCAQYCIWPNGPNDTNAVANLWLTGDYIESDQSASFYASGRTGSNYRTWTHIKEIVTVNGGSGFNILGGGKHYIRSDKIASPNSTAYAIRIASDVQSPEVWLDVQKLSGKTSDANYGMLTVDGGTVYASIQHFEDLTGLKVGLQVTGGTLHLSGGTVMQVLNGVGIKHTGGTADIEGVRVDTTNTNAAGNYPALVSAAGLILRNCVLLAPALSECVHSAAAQTITNYGSVANKAKSGNITVNVVAITVDANVV